MKSSLIRKLRDRRGITLVWLALFMLPLLLMFAGLAIDLSYMYYVKNELQVAADAAALAGAARLENTSNLAQPGARDEASAFALKNKAAGAPVTLELSGNSNTLSESNDVTVGNWDFTTRVYTAGQTPVNAIEVRPKKVAGLFFGRIFRLLGTSGTGWLSMRPTGRAIAARQPLKALGIPLCVKSCFIAVPNSFVLSPSAAPACVDNFMAWTAFNILQAPDVGPNGDVSRIIGGEVAPPTSFCDLCITTNNGVGVGGALGTLEEVFLNPNYDKANKTFDSTGNVIRWRVAAPIVDAHCNSMGCLVTNPDPDCCACPPAIQGQPTEPYHIRELAVVDITSVNRPPSPGMTISNITCGASCSSVPLGEGVALVK